MSSAPACLYKRVKKRVCTCQSRHELFVLNKYKQLNYLQMNYTICEYCSINDMNCLYFSRICEKCEHTVCRRLVKSKCNHWSCWLKRNKNNPFGKPTTDWCRYTKMICPDCKRSENSVLNLD